MTQTFTTQNVAATATTPASYNDIFIGPNGNLAISTGLQAVLQACATAAKLQLGEAIYYVDNGVPNFQLIWNGVPNIQQWEVALTNVLESVVDVVDVLSLNVIVANNAVSYTAVILTIYGEGIVNGNF